MAKFILKNSIALTSSAEVSFAKSITTNQKYFIGGEPVELLKEEVEEIKKEFGDDFVSELKEEKKEEVVIEAITEEAAIPEKKKTK